MQQSLFTLKTERIFSGADYKPVLDEKRLARQIDLLRDFMLSADRWLTLSEICDALRAHHGGHWPEASIQAQLRNLRKAEFGKYQVVKRRRGDMTLGLYEWTLTLPEAK